MPRYVRAPIVRTVSLTSGDWDVLDRVTMTVHASEPFDTGLLFPDGKPVMRISDPIGFLPRKDD